MDGRGNQATERAHLRELPRCPCGNGATVELRNGLNAVIGIYCRGCGTRALKRFKRGEPR